MSEGTPAVIVLSGPLAGTIVDVEDELSIGRRPESGLHLSDELVSRRHAVIVRRSEGWLIEDLGSRTGTIVDGSDIGRSRMLEDGAKIVVGQTLLQFSSRRGPLDRAPTALVPPLVFEPNTDVMRVALEPPPASAAQLTPRRSERATHDGLRLGGAPNRPVSSLIKVAPGDPSLHVSLAHKDASELRRAGEHLQTLLTANSIIASELDLDKLFEKILDQIFNALPAHRAVILTQPPDSAGLVISASRVAGPPGLNDGRDRVISQSIVNQAFEQRVAVLTLDAGQDARFDTKQSVVDMNIRSAICVPMIHHDAVLGVIYLDTFGITHAFVEDDLRLLTGIAGPAAGAVKNALLVQKLRSTAIDTILRLAIAAEYRDDETGFHIHRMSDYAEAIARGLGLPSDVCETLKLASPMHDVGKIGIRDAILKKPGRLSREEFEEMKKHTVKGGAILSSSDSELLRMAERIALTHHERFDGAGYPNGLAGEAIPLEGRIVAVADVFDALTSRRCYKQPFAADDAFEHIAKGRGAHFDPRIVDCFAGMRDGILAIREHYLALEASDTSGGPDRELPTLLRRRPPRAPI